VATRPEVVANGAEPPKEALRVLRRFEALEYPGLDPVWWTFLISRAETRENVHDDSASETLVYTRVQSTHR
jgi:hypothetical protein